ncbi:hypothetical protein POM88_004425 [Heracleum sosnowskyi]|uniref:Uncharacterized protein n=1 Tax=Heracleum sosnowskyi TaxID=360622 RepID=A0AAD8N7P6_9APIA|nr:hypothetical protein POM88_004425 [Heracleum sosnowskyi]
MASSSPSPNAIVSSPRSAGSPNLSAVLSGSHKIGDSASTKPGLSLFSFYKRDGSDSTQTPAPASSNSVPVTPNQPNHLPIDEMEVIVETPNKPTIQTDPGLRDPICTFPVNQQDRIRKEMSDQHSRKRMKSLFSFYKRDGSDSTQTPAPASSNSVPVTPNQPNHLPIDEMGKS